MIWKSVAAVAIVAIALGAAGSSMAAPYTVTYTGVVYGSGNINQLDEFGGGDLTGDAFVATYTFDPSLGLIDTVGGITLAGGSAYKASDPLISASLKVNGYTMEFGPTGVYTADYRASSFLGSEVSDDDYFLFSNALNGVTPPASLEQPYSGGGSGPGAYQLFVGDKETSFGLKDTSAVVSLAGAPSAAPEPSVWMLMLMGIGGLGLILRHRPRRLAWVLSD